MALQLAAIYIFLNFSGLVRTSVTDTTLPRGHYEDIFDTSCDISPGVDREDASHLAADVSSAGPRAVPEQEEADAEADDGERHEGHAHNDDGDPGMAGNDDVLKTRERIKGQKICGLYFLKAVVIGDIQWFSPGCLDTIGSSPTTFSS